MKLSDNMAPRREFPGDLHRLLRQTPPVCAWEDCQQLSEWAAVAPSVTIFGCAEHLGRMLNHDRVWFVEAFKTR